MRKTGLITFVCCAGLVLLAACSKNNNTLGGTIGDSTTTATRLAGWGNALSQFNLEYDAAGKITRLTYKVGNGPQQVVYNISYAANKVVMSAPVINDANFATTDSIFIVLDGNGRIANTVRHLFKHLKTQSTPQRIWQDEIVKYEYDGAGFLIKQIRSLQDSTLTNYGYIETSIARTLDTVVRTHTAGNLTTTNDYRFTQLNVRTPSNETMVSARFEFTNTLSYIKAYPNKIDFTNQVVLSKFINLSPFQFDSKYTLLPDKIATHIVEKDETGKILNTSDQTENYEYTYGVNGLVYSKMNLNSNEGKVYYIYK